MIIGILSNRKLEGTSNNCFCSVSAEFFRLARSEESGILVNIPGFSRR